MQDEQEETLKFGRELLKRVREGDGGGDPEAAREMIESAIANLQAVRRPGTARLIIDLKTEGRRLDGGK